MRHFQRKRSGAVLLEVLIAVLAMGIGVISLMSLFPLAVVRSAQGHQLTVSTGHRLNVEAMLDTYPYIWTDPNRNGDAAEHGSEIFFVDPLGIARGLPNTIGTPTRYSAGFNTLPLAQKLCEYDANWQTMAEETITPPQALAAANFVVLGPNTNLTAVPDPNLFASRIMFFDSTGKFSRTKPVVSITNPAASPTVDWTGTGTLTLSDIAKVRVETREGQYSWMLCCRRHDIGTKRLCDIYVVEFFRREFPEGGDTIYGNAAGIGFNINEVFRAGQTNVYISGITAGNEPRLRRGGWVLDPQNIYWYRIADYEEGPGTLRVLLDKTANFTSNAAVFMRGVTDVYYIGTKEF